MTGFVVDPFTSSGYLQIVAGANDGNGGGGVTAPGPNVVPVPAYAVTNNGTISTQFFPFANPTVASSVAQALKNGLDADNGAWGLQIVSVDPASLAVKTNTVSSGLVVPSAALAASGTTGNAGIIGGT